MSVDPTDPETFEDGATSPDADPGVEIPEADAADQRTDVADDEDTPRERARDDANEADVAEQSRGVALGEEDYR